MIFKKLFISLFVLSASTCLFTSCMTAKKFSARANKNIKIIPADYDPARHTLLVLEVPRLNNPNERNNSVTNKLDKALREYCPYKYEIASMKDIKENKDKYGDTSIYKYAILNTLYIVQHTTTTTITQTTNTGTNTHSVSPTARSAYIDFLFYDRVNNMEYPRAQNDSPNIEWAVAAYMDLIKMAKK